MSTRFKFLGTYRRDGLPDDFVAAVSTDDGKLQFEMQGDFAGLILQAIELAQKNPRFIVEMKEMSEKYRITNMGLTKVQVKKDTAVDIIRKIMDEGPEKEEAIAKLEGTYTDKKVASRNAVIQLNDPVHSSVNIVIYEDKTVDVEITGNKAEILQFLIETSFSNPAEARSYLKVFEGVSQAILSVAVYGVPNQAEAFTGSIEEVTDKILETANPETKAEYLKMLIDNIEKEDHLLTLLSKIKGASEFPNKQETIEYGQHVYARKYKPKGSC